MLEVRSGLDADTLLMAEIKAASKEGRKLRPISD